MWINKEVMKEDLEAIIDMNYIPWDKLIGQTVLITGAMGLIGSLLINALLFYSKIKNVSIHVLALVRNLDKANQKFKSQLQEGCDLLFIEGDVCRLPNICQPVNYIVHAASVTQSKAFMESPVETILTNIQGTNNLLELAKSKKVASFIYLSTMEVYGAHDSLTKVTEKDFGFLDPAEVRSCYPVSKKAAECLCCAYHAEHGVPVKIARLTLTFGPGVVPEDNRVFSQFCKSVLNNKDIVLHTAGETTRDYLYTVDAISAILTILLKGENGEAYNVSNTDTCISICDMARLVARECAGEKIQVIFDIPDNVSQYGYAPTLKLNLDTQKLQALGWKATTDLVQMYRRLLVSLS